ncbi:MAG: hypothetical protein HYR94_19870 [Chloroflexi bacterium]|nr:hypothetical protein [Chloroflexota bacterium]
MAKIFVRERHHVGELAGRPRFAIVGVEGSDLKFFKPHVRRSELDAIAQSIGAEVIMLPQGSDDPKGQGKGERRRRKHHAEG